MNSACFNKERKKQMDIKCWAYLKQGLADENRNSSKKIKIKIIGNITWKKYQREVNEMDLCTYIWAWNLYGNISFISKWFITQNRNTLKSVM